MCMRKILIALAVFALSMASTSTFASPVDSDPKTMIVDRHDKFHALLTDKKAEAPKVREGIRSVLKTFVNFEAVSRQAFKKYFDKLKPAERKRFTNAFKGLVEATYLKRLEPGHSYEMLFDGEPEMRKGKARVRTIIKKGDSEVEVAYLLDRGETQSWKAYDIVIDDVSMARNYRREFYRLMKEKGFSGLIERIEERTREKEKEL